jgi:hypothetical protein
MTNSTNQAPADLDQVARLARVRNGVRAVLALGIAASVAANILHAEASIVGRLVAAWPPVALLLAIELLSRVPVHRPFLSAARLTATAAVAGIAAWVSYWHMVSVAAQYGETSTSAHLIPVSVDGLVVVASVCLVELAARINTLTTTRTATATNTAAEPGPVEHEDQADEPRQPVSDPAGRTAPASAPVPARARRAVSSPPASRTTRTGSRTGTATGEAIARARARHPEWTTAQIAARAGVTDRTVRRHLSGATASSVTSATAADVATSAEGVAA